MLLSTSRSLKGFSLTEVLIATAITGLVTVGMWQSLKYINQSTFRLTEQMFLNAEIQQLEEVLQLNLGSALDSRVQYGGNCLVLLSQDQNSDSQSTRVWRVGDAALPNALPSGDADVALFERVLDADQFSSADCLDADLDDPSWRNVSGDGQIKSIDIRASARFASGHSEVTMPAGWQGSHLSTGDEYVTIEFWFKQPEVTNGSGHGLIRYGHETDDQKAIKIFIENSGLMVAAVGAHRLRIQSPAVDDNNWHHVAVSYNKSLINDPDDGTPFDIFLDGEKKVGSDANIAGGNVNVEARTLGTGAALEIGEPVDYWGVRPAFVGDMDELRIWEEGDGSSAAVRDAVANRIQAYFRESEVDTGSEGTLVARFSFDDDKLDSNGFVANAGSSDTRIDATSGLSVISGAQASPAASSFFGIDFSKENRIVKANFWVSSERGTETIGRIDRQETVVRSARQKPVVAVKPSGIVAIPEGGYARLEVTVEGGRSDFDLNDIAFEAVFDPGLATQGNACNDLQHNVTTNCQFNATSSLINLTGSSCRRVLGGLATDVECFIKSTGNQSTIQGIRFITARVKESDVYSSIPGDQFTFQMFEPCTAPDTENDNGDGSYTDDTGDYQHWTILADIGTIDGGRFINKRSYTTYSWEGFHDGLMSDHFNSNGGTGTELSRYTNGGSIQYSPDWQFWTRRNHISPVLFHQQEDDCPFEATPSTAGSNDDCKVSPNGWYFIAAFDRAGSRNRANATDIQNIYKKLFNKTTNTNVVKPSFDSSTGRIVGRRPNVYWVGDEGTTNEVSETVWDSTSYSHGNADDTPVNVGTAANHMQACERSQKLSDGTIDRYSGGSGETLTDICASGFGRSDWCDGTSVKSGQTAAQKWCTVAWEMSNMPVAPSGSYDKADDLVQKWPVWYDESNEFSIDPGSGQVPPIGTIMATNGWRNGNVDGYAALMTTQNDPRQYNNSETDPNRRNPTFRVFYEGGVGNWLLQTSPMNVTGTVTGTYGGVTYDGISYGPTSVPIVMNDTDAMRFNLTTAIQCPYTPPTAPPPQ